ncbi:hypothetical protein LTR72_002043 [Exophiala xenobiotica]|nr:hypothetical protein LTR72_002043 [Exophiala xenobiotica]KAK5302405.1 hypothetical protein LTR14_000654 [Exophiala xenobiotica]KAK5480541.1 hypothetical protein LTR55_007044 [Exophiala xenobiotica]
MSTIFDSPSDEMKAANSQTRRSTSDSANPSLQLSPNPLLSEDDPRHPYNWPRLEKWTQVIILSIVEFVTPLASMIFAPVVPQVAADIADDNITRTTLAVSIYVLGFIVGPLIFGPLSQLYGRMVIYRTTVAVYLLMSTCCALSVSIEMLTVFRFFGGCFGAAPIVIGGAAVSDMYPAVRRGRPMTVYSVGPFLGLTSGPIFGGLINSSCGWRWIFWSLSIAAGVLSICTFVILRETHLPTISHNLTQPPRSLSQQWLAYLRRFSLDPGFRNRLHTVLLPAFWSPVRITFSSMNLFLLFVSNAIFTGILNILFTTLGATYQSRYHFTTHFAGLAYLGIGIGGVIASVILSNMSDKLVLFMSRRVRDDKNQHLERYRLPPIIFGDLLVSAGLLWYGWTLQSRSTWIVPLIGTFFFGLGMLSIQAGFPTYLTHAHPDQAGAVLSASIVTRSIGGSTITLAGPSLNKRLGYGWASTVLATINLIFLLPAVMLYRQPTTRRRDLKMNEGPESVSTPENMGTPSPNSEAKRNEPVHPTEMLDDPDAINIVRV